MLSDALGYFEIMLEVHHSYPDQLVVERNGQGVAWPKVEFSPYGIVITMEDGYVTVHPWHAVRRVEWHPYERG